MADAFLGALQLAYILNGAVQMLYIAVRVESADTLQLNVAQAAVRAHDTRALPRKFSGVQQLLERVVHQLAVVGMHEIEERLEAHAHLAFVDAENAIGLGRP